MTSFGSAFPPEALITWPTRKPITFTSPERYLSTASGFCSITEATMPSSSAVSEIWSRSLFSATSAGLPSPSITPASTSLAADDQIFPSATMLTSSAMTPPSRWASSTVQPRRRKPAVTSPVTQLAAALASAPAATASS